MENWRHKARSLSYMRRRPIAFDDFTRVGRGKLLINPTDLSVCVRSRSGVRLAVPHIEASWWELLAPIHHSEFVSIVSFPLHVQLDFPEGFPAGTNKRKQSQTISGVIFRLSPTTRTTITPSDPPQ